MENKELDRKQRALREIGKVLVNFGNLAFTSLVLGTIIKGDFNRFLLLVTGGVIVVMFVTVGVILLTITGGEKWN